MGPRKLKCLLVVKAVDSLYSEFRAVDNLVARNTARVLKAYQNARVGYHHFGGSTGYGHEETRGREALDKAFAEIFGAESAIFRSQVFFMLSVLLLLGVVCHFVNRHCYFASRFFQVLMQSLVLCLPSKGQG
ncbi:uncharacterized protein LOC100250269 [Vitis vinifera]|uniref:uncharacterized protein LOC100250269 n=1 Tax=Vitis vinifera TaxID=29760 RepID=UPI002882E8A5|nr:uncharacterized protein LOC100250269 [Vitis vinifera]